MFGFYHSLFVIFFQTNDKKKLKLFFVFRIKTNQKLNQNQKTSLDLKAKLLQKFAVLFDVLVFSRFRGCNDCFFLFAGHSGSKAIVSNAKRR